MDLNKNASRWLKVSLVILLLISASACVTKKSQPLKVSGRVYVSGNEPFTNLMIEAYDGSVYCIIGSLASELRGRQGAYVTVEGSFTDVFCPSKAGKSINVTEYELRK